MAAGAAGQGGIRPGAVADMFGILGAALTLSIASSGWWFLAARRQRGADNDYLAAMAEHTASIFTASAALEPAEMSLEHLQRLRFALDRALQPPAEFNGFEKLDQFQTAATRYQLNFLAYGVALTQARYTPAFGGAMPLAMPCFFLNPIAPDLARRQWLLLRRRLFDRKGHFRRRAFWPVDTGNYGFSRASAYAATALAAAELGDIVSPEFHMAVKDAKDIAAGAVLIAAVAAAVIGIVTFWPYCSSYWVPA